MAAPRLGTAMPAQIIGAKPVAVLGKETGHVAVSGGMLPDAMGQKDIGL